MSKWKLVPPTPGEPKQKTVNGKAFKWCAKCNNWTIGSELGTNDWKYGLLTIGGL